MFPGFISGGRGNLATVQRGGPVGWYGSSTAISTQYPHNETGSRTHEHEAIFPTWYKGNQIPEVSGGESRAEKPDCFLWGLSTS